MTERMAQYFSRFGCTDDAVYWLENNLVESTDGVCDVKALHKRYQTATNGKTTQAEFKRIVVDKYGKRSRGEAGASGYKENHGKWYLVGYLVREVQLFAPSVEAEGLDDSAMDDSAMDDSAMDDSAMDDSAIDDSAMNDSAMNDSAVADQSAADSILLPVIIQGKTYIWATTEQKLTTKSGDYLWMWDDDKERLEKEGVLLRDDKGVLCFGDGIPVDDHCTDCGVQTFQCECYLKEEGV